MRAGPRGIVGAVLGAAAGGGRRRALAGDIRDQGASAVFAESFVKIGLIPDWGGHYLLTRLVGASQAMELMMLGDRIDAETALRLGLVNAVFSDDSFRERVIEKAIALAAVPREAIALIKHGVIDGSTGSLDQTLAYEMDAQRKVFLSEDAREGINAFLEKRAPVFGQKP